MIEIDYTHHAIGKFDILNRHGFVITPDQVKETITNPDILLLQSGGRYIAQKGISEDHVLRVIYRKEGTRHIVITFYPGRRDRYED